MVDGEERVELLRTHEPLRAEMLRELLEEEGIPVATPGLEHRAMLGVAGGYVEIVLQVPRRDLERARALVEALDAAPMEGGDLRDEGALEERAVVGYRQAARGPSTVFGKRRRVAAAASMVLPGGGHVYVAEWRTAGLVAACELAALVLAGAGVPYAVVLLPLMIAADALGASWHCERLARGSARPSWRRRAPLAATVLGIAWVALMWTGAGAARLAGPRSTLLCDVVHECWQSDRRECLWDAAAGRIEPTILPGCESCLREATDCDAVSRCGACWDD